VRTLSTVQRTVSQTKVLSFLFFVLFVLFVLSVFSVFSVVRSNL
jgi:hypothetical protein